MDVPNHAEINLAAAISPQRVTRALLMIVFCLVIFSLIGHFMQYFLPDFPLRDPIVSKFALNKEQNFPTLYSSLALLLCSGLLFLIAQAKAKVRNRYTRYWYALSLIFAGLSLDEIMGFHELASAPLHRMGVNGFLYNAWLVPASFFLVLFFIAFAKFFFHFPKTTRRLFLLATALFLGGACFIELLDGYYAFLHGKNNFGYAMFSTLEETLEMLGIVVFIHALLRYITCLGIKHVSTEIYVYPDSPQADLPQWSDAIRK